MKKSLFPFCAVLTLGLCSLIFSVLAFSQEEPSYSVWDLWLGSHYTDYEDFYKKVGEFDRGKEGIFHEMALDYSVHRGDKHLDFSGNYYDPKRLSFDVRGASKDIFAASLSYRSFYRQRETDLLGNLMAREAVDQENKPGGKMFTYEHEEPGADFGYTRSEIQSHYEVNVPGSADLRFFAAHRSILEKGEDQKIISMHCSSCHMVSRSVDVDRRTHSASVGFEVEPGPVFFSYEGSYRTFKSDVPTSQAFYDTAQHPVNGTMIEEFGSRMVFQGEVVEFGKIPETKKMSHTAKIKADVGGRGEVFGSFTYSQAKNVSAGIKTTGVNGNLKYLFRPNVKTRVLATASVARIEADDVFIDLPLWREGLTGGGQDFDYTRYSSLTRTVARGSAECTYQPSRAYRLSLSTGYEEIKRDDYPYFEADGKTTKLTLSAGARYRPSLRFSGRLNYSFQNIDDPFSTYNNFFERAGVSELTLLPDNGNYYYFQRDDLRYGSLTNQPSNIHRVDSSITFRLDRRANFSAGFKADLGTNSDTDSLDFERTTIQPHLSMNLSPALKWNFFGDVGYIYNKSNGLAAVAMMDG